MSGFCKVCGVKLKAGNTVDYRPGSCRDCELERKKLYSGISFDASARRSTKKVKKAKKVKLHKLSKSKKKTKRAKLDKAKLRKQKLLKAKKLAKFKKLSKIRAQRDKKKKKLRVQLERLRKQRAKKLQRLKLLKKKQKERDRKERDRLKKRLRKAREIERRLLKKERERLRKEKEKLRQLARQEKERIRGAKRAEKERIRAEKQRVRLEKQKEKERLKKAKEAAKLAIIQARESARKAAQEARRLREEAKKPPMFSVVTRLKEMQPPPDVKVIGATPKEHLTKTPQPTKKQDPKRLTIADAALLDSATVISATGKEEKGEAKQAPPLKPNEPTKKAASKFQKDPDPIIDRYNPYTKKEVDPNVPRPPSPTPWLASNFSVVKGDFKETKAEEGAGGQSGLSEEQVKDIIEKVKNEHKRKST